MYQDRNWLFKNIDKLINDIGGWDNMMNEKFYDFAIKNIDLKKIDEINLSFKNFISSKYQSITISDTCKI